MAEFKSFSNTPSSASGGSAGGAGGADRPGKIAEKTSTGKFFVDYKRADDLRRFMTPNGKVQGRKKTGLTAREQRMVAQAIKRARYMALLPYTSATV